MGISQTLQLEQWNDQELYTLFATRLPALTMPADFVEQLTHSVLDELERQVNQLTQAPWPDPPDDQRITRTAGHAPVAKHRRGLPPQP